MFSTSDVISMGGFIKTTIMLLFDLVKEKFIDKLKEITHDFRGMVLREGKDDNERLMKIR